MSKITRLAVALAMVIAISGTGHAWFLDMQWGLGNDSGGGSSITAPLNSTGTANLPVTSRAGNAGNLMGHGATNIWESSNASGAKSASDTPPPPAVPEPTTLLLLGAGLLGGGILRRKLSA